MQTSLLSLVALPLGLALIMLGLGLSLTVADFRRAATARKAVLVALTCQMLVMPGLCVLLVETVDAAPTVAVGMLVLAASPGGTLAVWSAGAALAFGIFALLAAVTPTLALEVPVMALLGASAVTFAATINSLIQLRVEPAMRGRVMALYTVVVLGSNPIGAPLMGWLSEAYEPRVALAVMAVAGLAVAALARIGFARIAEEDPKAVPAT